MSDVLLVLGHLASLAAKKALAASATVAPTPAARAARPGLGIGLALVREFVKQHGGSVTAHSTEPGQGSEFTVHLPTES